MSVTVTDQGSIPSPRATAAPARWVAAAIFTFRDADGRDARHHFEVGEDGTIQVWEHWLTKGPLIMQGQLVKGDQLRLERVGLQPGEPLLLTRQRMLGEDQP